VLYYFQVYLFWCAVFLFLSLLLLRRLAARVYRAAVLKVLRDGTVSREELHPVLARWLDRLEMFPIPVASYAGLHGAVRAGGHRAYRWLLGTAMFVIGFLFVAQTYVGEFFLRHPGSGFVNHVLVQFPALDYVPGHLHEAAARE
jgi:hypothetical protein